MSSRQSRSSTQSSHTIDSMPISPAFEGFSPAGFEFLEALAENNQRDWYQAHKVRYHQHVRDPFVAFIEGLSFRLEGSGLNLRGGKQSVFRLYRDTRFAKDKTPYKTHAGGVLSYSGTKKDSRGIVYVQFASDGGFMAAGFYQPESKVLRAIREAIAQDPKAALAITHSLAAKKLPVQATASLKRMPRGFEAFKDSEALELLKMKGYIVRQALAPDMWKSADIIESVAQFAYDVYPWIAFGREAIAQLAE